MSLSRKLSAWLLPVVLAGCQNGKLVERQSDRYDRSNLAASLAESRSEAGLVLGIFPLAPNAIIDGDTIKVAGLDASLRLLGLDTEETWKSKKDFKLYEQLGFERYLEVKEAKSSGPYKGATPLGMDAKDFAEDFFRGATHVRLERDHPKEIRDRFGRYLSYVFVKRDGEWVNYNVECVRAGMSPYFAKYGYSRRFHDEFVEAQREAREAERGIWDPKLEHYRDYDLRLLWWDGRGDFVSDFWRVAEKRDDHIDLTHWDALDRLERAEGKEVTLLATVSGIRPAKGNAPTRVLLGRRLFSDFPLIFYDERVLERSNIRDATGFVVVRGTVSSYRYRGKRGRPGGKQLQIVIRNPEQILAWSASVSRPGRTLDGKVLPSARDLLGVPEPSPSEEPPSETSIDPPVEPAEENADDLDTPVLPEPDDTTDVVPPPPPPAPPPP